MELFVAVFALSALVAIVFNYGSPKLLGSTNPSLVKLQGNYFGKTLLTTVVIFLAILAAGFLIKEVSPRIASQAARAV